MYLHVLPETSSSKIFSGKRGNRTAVSYLSLLHYWYSRSEYSEMFIISRLQSSFCSLGTRGKVWCFIHTSLPIPIYYPSHSPTARQKGKNTCTDFLWSQHGAKRTRFWGNNIYQHCTVFFRGVFLCNEANILTIVPQRIFNLVCFCCLSRHV